MYEAIETEIMKKSDIRWLFEIEEKVYGLP